jgi:methylenetetrahydrofolate reductase (NADPH)
MGLDVTLVTQFCFDSAALITLAKQLRDQGVRAPLRIGVAGPANGADLVKYALICGVRRSVRALRRRNSATGDMPAGETPEAVIKDVALAQASNPALKIDGVHFFNFGSLAATAKWVDGQRVQAFSQ